MDFKFTPEQEMLREGLSRYFRQNYSFEQRRRGLSRGDDTGTWQHLADFGLLALPLTEAAGGMSGTVTDLVAVADLFGRHLVRQPFVLKAVITGSMLSLAVDRPHVAALLKEMAAGTATAAFAHEEGIGTARLDQLTTTLTAGNLVGTKRLVAGAHDASAFVVSARTDTGIAILLVGAEAPGVSLTRYRTIDGHDSADVKFEGVEVANDSVISLDKATIETLIGDSIIVLCAEAVGAMEALLEQTSAFAAVRKQFGQPIGTFQAISHRLADMKIACVKARATLLYTSALAQSGKAQSRDVSLLKAQVGRLGRSVGESAIQIHGGVGTTDELAIGHFLKRILAIDMQFGSSEFHFQQVGRVLSV